MTNIKTILFILVTLVLTACESLHDPVPENYTGETVFIEDSFKKINQFKGYLFFVEEIDGKKIESIKTKTRTYGWNNNATILFRPYLRKVPLKTMQLKLVLKSIYVEEEGHGVSGVVDFQPKVGVSYIVKGKISGVNRTVWLEEVKSGKVITEIVSGKVDI